MKKTTMYVLGLIIAMFLVFASIVSAFGAGLLTEDQKSAIKQAIANNDFEAWKNAITATLTQENFNKIVQRYNQTIQRKELMKAMRQAISDRNYTAYEQAFNALKSSIQPISEDEFNAMVEHYNSTESGNGWGFRRGGPGRNFMRW